MFIDGSKEYLERFSSRLIEVRDGPAFVVTLQNWHWEVFRFCQDNGHFETDDWHIRGAWSDAQREFDENGTPLGETINRGMAFAALLAAEAELNDIDGHANNSRQPGWQDQVVSRSTGGVMTTCGTDVVLPGEIWDISL